MLEQNVVILHWNHDPMLGGCLQIGHLHKKLITQFLQICLSSVVVNLGVFGVPTVDAMPIHKFGLVLVEAISHEYRNIVTPSITRRSRQKYPMVVLGYLVEGFNPCSGPYQTLLVKDEKCPSNGLKLLDVIPAIYDHSTRLTDPF